jgi:hypothetical protein
VTHVITSEGIDLHLNYAGCADWQDGCDLCFVPEADTIHKRSPQGNCAERDLWRTRGSWNFVMGSTPKFNLEQMKKDEALARTLQAVLMALDMHTAIGGMIRND